MILDLGSIWEHLGSFSNNKSLALFPRVLCSGLG